MEQTPFTLHSCRCLIIGNGRVGSMLARRLKALCAQVSVSARKAQDIARIEADGLSALHTDALAGKLDGFDLIFNTVPAAVLGDAELSSIKKSCLIIDLASLPGGIDTDSPPPTSCRILHALSLPGKVAPVSAAAALHDTILTILQEEGVL